MNRNGCSLNFDGGAFGFTHGVGEDCGVVDFPRALPWAGMIRPVGAGDMGG